MKRPLPPPPRRAALALAAGLIAACRTASSSPASEEVRPVVRAEAASPSAPRPAPADTSHRRYTPTDVQFMQNMIAHHAQALAMTQLVPSRSRRDDIRLLAERIDVSQKSEIALMQRWLKERGQEVPSVDARHEHHDPSAAAEGAAPAGQHSTMHHPMPAMMPGMLTAEQMARLAAATGADFDRQFLDFMIRHHEGALQMVATLFATQGAGQEPEVYQFASDVDASQNAEIERMRALQGLPRPSAPPR